MKSASLAARRKFYLLLVVLIPLSGLGIRARPQMFSAFCASYAPDVLWAWLVLSLVVVIAPRLEIKKVVAAASSFCLMMECSQLYQAPWLHAVRATRVGGLLLGMGFLWSDLSCYMVGIGVGIACDRALCLLLARRNS